MYKIIANARRCNKILAHFHTCVGREVIANKSFTIHMKHDRILYKSINGFRFCSTEGKEDMTPLTESEMQELTNGDEDLEKKLKIILLETEVLRQDGDIIPSNEFLKLQHWQELLKMPTRSSRKKYLNFLFKLEKKRENEVEKKEQRRMEIEQRKLERQNEESDGHLKYGLGHNSFLLRIQDNTINNFYNNNLMKAMQFGQKLVVDCGYSDHMTRRENTNCAKQLTLLFAENRFHDDPFDVHYCNAHPKSSLIQFLHRSIPTMYEKSFPFNVHEKSYLELFPKERLVYLTPHCREEITEFDHDAIYIIGAIVDKTNSEPVSMGKAKQEGLKMKKLPLDRYLQWGAGSGKSLTLNQMILILLDAKTSGDWNYALRHVPKRKLNQGDPIGSAIKSFKGLSYDVDRRSRISNTSSTGYGSKSNTGWVPKKGTEKQEKGKLIHIKSILKD